MSAIEAQEGESLLGVKVDIHPGAGHRDEGGDHGQHNLGWLGIVWFRGLGVWVAVKELRYHMIVSKLVFML